MLLAKCFTCFKKFQELKRYLKSDMTLKMPRISGDVKGTITETLNVGHWLQKHYQAHMINVPPSFC